MQQSMGLQRVRHDSVIQHHQQQSIEIGEYLREWHDLKAKGKESTEKLKIITEEHEIIRVMTNGIQGALVDLIVSEGNGNTSSTILL